MKREQNSEPSHVLSPRSQPHRQRPSPVPQAGKSPQQQYAAVVGTVEQTTEHPIIGRAGDHLQFYLDVGGGARYQVDVNTQSSDGSDIEVYIADQDVNAAGSNPDEPFKARPPMASFPMLAVSYKAMGLNDGDFAPLSDFRIDGQLESALNAADFVTVYGMTFDDGGPDGKGVHETHYNKGKTNQDGGPSWFIRWIPELEILVPHLVLFQVPERQDRLIEGPRLLTFSR